MGKTSVAQILVTRDRISMEDAMIRVNECVRRLQVEAIQLEIMKRLKISSLMNSDLNQII